MSKTSFDSVNKIWSGSKLPTIYNSNVSAGYLVLNILQNTPESITQVSADTGIALTCQQMYERTISIAIHMQKLGCNEGDVVGFIASNNEHVAPAVFACLTLGLPVNSLATIVRDGEMHFFYSNTKPKLIFCDAAIVEKVKRIVDQLPTHCIIITVDNEVSGFNFIGEALNNSNKDFVIPHLNANAVAFILTSSGTSDKPKQVVKTHKEIIEGFRSQWISRLPSQEIWFSFTSIYWIVGVLSLLTGTFYGGKTIITTRPFNPNLMLDIINKYNVTTTFVTPMHLTLLLDCGQKKSSTSLKFMFVVGLPVTKEICERAKFLFLNCEIAPAYGSTEGGFLSLNLSKTKYGSVGQLYGNVEMKILDDRGRPSEVGDSGEIVYRTPTIFGGYFNDPEKTNEAIKDGWVHSGDVGYFDKDGFLYIVDRKKDIFKYEGMKVSAAELEQLINKMDGVSECCVVGVYQQDVGKDLIFAFVVRSPDSQLTEKYVEESVSARVIDGKRIRGGVHFTDFLPKTIFGKVRKGEVRTWAMEIYRSIKS